LNIKCVALTEEQYKESIALMRKGFVLDGENVKPNRRIATILILEATLGLRLGDVLALKMTSFIKDADRWRLNIVEKKTSKARVFTVPAEAYAFIQTYAYDMGIGKDRKLFDISERQVQRYLSKVCDFLGYYKVSSHSYRKYFATSLYINNNYNIELVRVLLQHSSVAITQNYIGISSKEIETALITHMGII